MDDASMSRRRALRIGGAILAAGVAGCGSTGDRTTAVDDGNTAGGTTDERPTDPANAVGTAGTVTGTAGAPAVPDDLAVRARRLASGFTSPVGIEVPRPGRRFVVDQAGQIYLHDRDGLRDDPYLDLTDRMVDVGGYSEQGLLGLAFHPDGDGDGRFYVRYSAPPREGTPSNYSHTFVLSEFRADPGATVVDPDTERTVLEIPQPQSNHNAGAITFGPEGYLYVAVGDGGGANDRGTGHVEDWYDANPGGNGQDVTENLLGSVLRIDVDGGSSASTRTGGDTTDGREGGTGYDVPEDNPLVGREGLDEHYAWGFRNPWRMSFGPDGRLFVADVGQNAREEVSIVEKGGNYGWNVYEGTACFGTADCPAGSPDGRRLRPPVIEYPHGGAPVRGISVIGGYLYEGSAMPSMRRRYVFADWRASGRLFAATPAEGLWTLSEVSVATEESFGPNVLSFGRTPGGELLVCTTAESGVTGDSGAVFRLTSTG